MLKSGEGVGRSIVTLMQNRNTCAEVAKGEYNEKVVCVTYFIRKNTCCVMSSMLLIGIFT